MTELFAADLQRILWRPFTRALGVVVVIVVAMTGVIVFVKSGGRHPFDTLTALPAGFGSAAVLLTLAGFVLGATLFGADYSSRALTTLLTWEPRRPLVLTARAASCAAVAACAALATLALLCVALLPSVLAHGAGAVPTASWYLSWPVSRYAARCSPPPSPRSACRAPPSAAARPRRWPSSPCTGSPSNAPR